MINAPYAAPADAKDVGMDDVTGEPTGTASKKRSIGEGAIVRVFTFETGYEATEAMKPEWEDEVDGNARPGARTWLDLVLAPDPEPFA